VRTCPILDLILDPIQDPILDPIQDRATRPRCARRPRPGCAARRHESNRDMGERRFKSMNAAPAA
jgi:hypothetical protein